MLVLFTLCILKAISICKYIIRIAQAKGTIRQTNLVHVVKQRFSDTEKLWSYFPAKGRCQLTPQYVL